MVKMSSSYRIIQTGKDRNPVNYGMESPDHTYIHAFIINSLFRFVEANLKKKWFN